MSPVVSTQIVEPSDQKDHFWIPLEETHRVNRQKPMPVNPANWKIIVTHRRAFEHYDFSIPLDTIILCVGQRTRRFLEGRGFKNIQYHTSATQIILEDRYFHLWLRGDKFKVNFARDGMTFRENVVSVKTYSTNTLKNNVDSIVNLRPNRIELYSQEQYNLIKESGYVPETLVVVPSIKVDQGVWKEVVIVNPA